MQVRGRIGESKIACGTLSAGIIKVEHPGTGQSDDLIGNGLGLTHRIQNDAHCALIGGENLIAGGGCAVLADGERIIPVCKSTSGVFLQEKQIYENIDKIKKLNELAMHRGESLAQLALKWVMKDSDITSVLIGASKPEQILDNLKILEGSGLSEDELKLIDAISL